MGRGPRMRCGKGRGSHGARAWRVGEGASAATAGSPSSSAAVVANPIITHPRPRQRPPAQSFSFSLPPSSSPRHQTSIIAAAQSLDGLARDGGMSSRAQPREGPRRQVYHNDVEQPSGVSIGGSSLSDSKEAAFGFIIHNNNILFILSLFDSVLS